MQGRNLRLLVFKSEVSAVHTTVFQILAALIGPVRLDDVEAMLDQPAPAQSRVFHHGNIVGVSGRKRNFIIVKDGISPQSTSLFVHCLNVLRLDHRGIFSREHKFCAHVVDVHGLDHLAGRVVLHVDGHEHVIRGNLFDGL